MSNGLSDELAQEAQRLGLGLTGRPSEDEDEGPASLMDELAREATKLGFAPSPQPQGGRQGVMEEVTGFLRDAAVFTSPIEQVTHPIRSLQRRAVFGAGIAESVVGSLVNLMDVPETVATAIRGTETRIPVLSQMSDSWEELGGRFEASRDRLVSTGHFTPEEMRNLSVGGQAIGYIIPGVASYKGADLVGKGFKLASAPMARDVVAGMIFGSAFEEGDVRERIQYGLGFAAAGGILGLMMHPTRASLRGYLGLRGMEQSEAERVLAGVKMMHDPETGMWVPVIETAEQARILARLDSEVTTVATTPGGRSILQQAADHRAYVGAMEGMLTSGRTHAMIQDVSDLSGTVARIREMFPNLKVQSRPTGKGVGDIVVGRSGLGAKAYGEFSRTGHFPGQRVRYMGGEYEYVRSTPQRVVIRGPGGERAVNPGNVTFFDVGAITPSEAPPGAILEDFVQYYKENLDKLAGMRDYEGAAQAARDIPDNLDGTMLLPDWGAGVSGPPGSVAAHAYSESPQIQRIAIDLRQGQEGAIKTASADVAQLVPENAYIVPIPTAAEGAMDKFAQAIAQQVKGAEALPGVLRKTSEGSQFGRRRWGKAALTAEEIVFEGGLPQEVIASGRPVVLLDNVVVSGATGEAARRALGLPDAPLLTYARDLIPSTDPHVVPMTPREIFSLEAIVDAWAKERGVVFQQPIRGAKGQFTGTERVVPYDLDLFKAQAGQRVLKEMDRAVKEMLEPGERAAIEAMQKRWATAAQGAESSLDDIASTYGFSLQRLDNGYIVARHLDGKAAKVYANERAAKEGILGQKLYPRDMADTFGIPEPMSAAAGDGGVVTESGVLDFLNPPGTPPLAPLSKRGWKLLSSPPKIRNQLDWLKDFEDLTGIPVWSRAGRHVKDRLDVMERATIPAASAIERILSGFNTREVYKMFNYTSRTVGRNLGPDDLAKIQADIGVTPKMLDRIKLLREFDEAFTEEVLRGQLKLPIPDDLSYLEFYSRLIRPYMIQQGVYDPQILRKNFASAFGKTLPDELQEFALKHFQGDLSIVDQDLRLIYSKLIMDSFFDLHVLPTLNTLKPLVKINPVTKRAQDPFMISSLPENTRLDVLRRLSPDPRNPQEGIRVLEAAARLLGEQIAGVQGKLDLGPDLATGFINGILKMTGVKSDERVVRAWVAMSMSNLHGSMLGLRPRVIARDWWQTYFNLGTRNGFEFAGESMKKMLSPEGYAEPFSEAATRVAQRALPLGGGFDQLIEKLPIETIDGRNSIGAGVVKFLSRAGPASRTMSEKMLVPYSSQDQASRAWAYWWQKMHTDKWLRKLEAKEISAAEFWEKGMPFFHRTDKAQFQRMYDAGQRESALRYIAKTAADETHFVYGMLAQPSWMQTNVGRLVGTFGTWPMWQTELYWRRLRMGSFRQRAAFVARTGALATALGIIGYETGTSIYNWMSPAGWFSWAGGPYLDLAFDAREIITAMPDRKAAAMKRFLTSMPRMVLPGQGFYTRDLPQSLEAAANSGRPEYALYSVLIGRPQDVSGSYWSEVLVNPSAEVPRWTLSDLRRKETADRSAEQFRQLQYSPTIVPVPSTASQFGRQFPGLESAPGIGAPSPTPAGLRLPVPSVGGPR